MDELKSFSLGGLGEGDAELDISVEVLNFTITDVNTFNSGEGKTSSKSSVDGINVVLNEGVKLGWEGSSVDSKGGALDGDCSKRVWLDFTEDLSTLVRDVTNKAGTVILSNESLLSVNDKGDDVWSIEGSIFSGELELGNILGQLDLDFNGNVGTVFGGKLGDSSSEVWGGNVDT